MYIGKQITFAQNSDASVEIFYTDETFMDSLLIGPQFYKIQIFSNKTHCIRNWNCHLLSLNEL